MFKKSDGMSVDVDRAWDKLVARLKNDGLLSPENKKTVPFFVATRRVAAVVALCICGGAIALYLNFKNEGEPFVALYNGDISNTLVSTLEDGSMVYLASGAALTCPEPFSADKRQVSLRGDALFDVYSDKTCPFLIETEPALVEVTGTEFSIMSAGKDSFELSVLHGSVTVTLKSTGIPVRVESGEMVRLHDEHLQKTLSTDRNIFARYTEKMQFKDERLEHIVRVINKISDKPVVFADNDLGNLEMTIPFSNNTVIEMVELLCEGLDLKYTNHENEIVIGR
jgi:ferric-dicitrate binding protein FerR (iron transport regulator)